MSNKWRIVESRYDKDSGTSMCRVNTDIGVFHAFVTLNSEDMDIANSFDGQKFAEFKCRIKYLKKKKNVFRERAIGARNIYNTLLQSYDESEPFMIKLKKQVRIAEKEAKNKILLAKLMEKNYKSCVDETLRLRREMREKAEIS